MPGFFPFAPQEVLPSLWLYWSNDVPLKKTHPLRHVVKDWSRTYLRRHGFLEVDSPSFGPPIEEYGNLHFDVTLPDGRQMYLNHSPQFFKQAMIAAGYGRCFQFAHCFRWEELDPTRTAHLHGLVRLDFEF